MYILSCLSHRPKSDCSSSKSNKASISRVGLVDGVGIFVAELVDDFLYAVVVVGCKRFPDYAFKS